MIRRAAAEKERSLQIARLCERPQVTVEITEKTTKFEVDCWRVAHSRAASEAEAAAAAIAFFKSVRQRNSRYLVRQLGI
jgi:hypothetical protein